MERCRITTRQGAVYVIEAPVGRIAHYVFDSGENTIAVDTVVGYEMMPPEHLVIRTDEIMSVQSMSAENWALQQESEAQHYRRLLSETPQEQMAEALQKMVAEDD